MPENINSAPATDFRYSIRGLMFLVVFAALGSLLVRFDLSRWHDGLVVVVVGWVLVGIGSQLGDLSRAGCRASWNVRGTMVIEFLRRILLAFVLLGYLVWLVLHAPGVVSEAILGKLSWVESGMVESLFLLALISAMLLRAPPRDFVRNWYVRALRDVLVGICACVWLYYLYRDRLFVYQLVQRALGGMLAKLPYTDVFGDAHDEWVSDCFQSAFTAAAAMILAVVFVNILMRRWNGGGSKELFWILPLSLSLAVAAWEVSWAAFTGLPNVDPCWSYFGEPLSLSVAVDSLTGGVLLLMFVTEATLRVGLVEDPDADQKIQWRLQSQTDTHERPATLALLVVTVAGWLATEIYWRGEENGLLELRPTVWRTLQATLPRLLLDSPTILKVACILLALSILSWQRNSLRPSADAGAAPLRLSKFCVVWTSILATTVHTTATLLWLYYTVCLMPR